MDSSRQRSLGQLTLVIDALLIVASMPVAFAVHFGLRGLSGSFQGLPAFHSYALLVYVTVPLWLVLARAFGLHVVFGRVWRRGELFFTLLRHHAVGLVGVATVLFVSNIVLNRSLVVVFLASTFSLMYLERAIIEAWLRYQHAKGRAQLRMLVVGDCSEAMRSFVVAAQAADLPARVVGRLVADATEDPSQAPLGDVPTVGGLADIERVLHNEAIDEVVFFAPVHRPELVPQPLAHCEMLGVRAAFHVPLDRLAFASPCVEQRMGRSFVVFDRTPRSPIALAVKQAVDVVAAACGVVGLAPIFVLTALAVVIAMGRPVFFSQERAGLFGRRFRMVKFRTMALDAEATKDALAARNELSGPVFKVTNDPRITRLGRVLRRTSLDELPQLFNVLAGDMSLVGPRPLPAKEQEKIVGWHRRRLSVKPGITGLWQVSGRSDIDFNEWMKLDLEYVDRWSLWLDLWILLRTIPAVLSGKGAR